MNIQIQRLLRERENCYRMMAQLSFEKPNDFLTHDLCVQELQEISAELFRLGYNPCED